METPTTAWREPTTFAQGDTLLFERRLHDYPASDGWQLTYTMRGGAGVLPISFQSTADGDNHLINVPPATTQFWQPGDYLMVGQAINAAGNSALNIAAGETHQIFYNQLQVTQLLAGTPAGQPILSFAQKMVQFIEQVLLNKAQHDLLETRIEGTLVSRISPEKLRDTHAYWVQIVRNERDRDRAKNGQPSRNTIVPVFCIVPVGPTPYRAPGLPIAYE